MGILWLLGGLDLLLAVVWSSWAMRMTELRKYFSLEQNLFLHPHPPALSKSNTECLFWHLSFFVFCLFPETFWINSFANSSSSVLNPMHPIRNSAYSSIYRLLWTKTKGRAECSSLFCKYDFLRSWVLACSSVRNILFRSNSSGQKISVWICPLSPHNFGGMKKTMNYENTWAWTSQPCFVEKCFCSSRHNKSTVPLFFIKPIPH